MPGYEVFATRWDDPHVVEQIPWSGLEFTLPLSDHGECSFSATVVPGSTWRPALSVAMSGILVTRDEVPVWSGMLQPESQSGPRTFDFKAIEWGAFFETCPAVPYTYTGWNDHALFRDLIAQAEAVAGQNPGITLLDSSGARKSDLLITPWDTTTVEEQFRRLGEAQGGPEWYFAATGTLDAPTRTLMLADRHGRTTPQAVLEYVEDTGQGYRGGNVFGHPGRQQAVGYTATLAVGAGDEVSQMRATASSVDLLAAGYPRRTKVGTYTDVTIPATLLRHAEADLAAERGMTTSYTFTTFEDDPDWTQLARGDNVRVELDTDVYGTERPLVFNTRILDMAVAVPDDGPAQVKYTTSDVRDY